MSNNSKSEWCRNYWRPVAAITYLLTVVSDYVVRPLINYFLTKNTELSQIVDKIKGVDPDLQLKIAEMWIQHQQLGAILPEFYHVTMAAILGAASWTRGQEKIKAKPN